VIAAASADWITLDFTGLFSTAACYVLAGGFALSAVAFSAAATTYGGKKRKQALWRSAESLLLALAFGTVLEMYLSSRPTETLKLFDVMAVFWAPGLAGLGALIIYATGHEG
jgi:hypothetical protein